MRTLCWNPARSELKSHIARVAYALSWKFALSFAALAPLLQLFSQYWNFYGAGLAASSAPTLTTRIS